MSGDALSRIESDRRARWARYREERGIPADAPFVGKHPLVECYEEALDALNYLEEAERQLSWLPASVRRPWSCVRTASYHARMAAQYCLGAMEILREQRIVSDLRGRDE